jgi:tetratricopeptide (TPR) repeat protein
MVVGPVVLSAVLAVASVSAPTTFMQQGETVYAKVADSVFVLQIADNSGTETGMATGFVVDANLLLTNAHVVNAGQVSVQVGPISLPCEVQRVDQLNDLALCRIQAKVNVSPLKFAAEDPKPGSTVYAIGNPMGLDKTISQGLFTGYREMDGRRVVQVSAAISPGSSGGPILNGDGDVVGVALAVLTDGQNLNFAVPLGVARGFVLNQPTSSDATLLVEAVRRLARIREETTFSVDPSSSWQKIDKEFGDQFQKALVAATDPNLIQQLFDTAASDSWHSDLMLGAAQKAITLSKRPDRQLYANLARALYSSNTDDNPTLKDAEQAAAKAVELGLGKNADDLLLLGDIEQSAGDNQGAYTAYRKAEALTKPGTPRAVEVYVDLFEASRDLGRGAEADAWFDKAKTEPGITAYNWAEYAAFLSKSDRDRESAQTYLEAYNRAPTLYTYLCEAGREYAFAKLLDEALSVERKCIETAASKPRTEPIVQLAHRIIATVLNERGVYDEAVSHAKEAIQLDASDAWAHHQLARALNSLRRPTEAVSEAKTALRMSDGKYAEMHFELGSAYFELRQWPEAQRAFQKAAEMNPRDATAAYNVAVSLYNDKYFDDALTWYREVLRRNPGVTNREQIQQMIDTLSRP